MNKLKSIFRFFQLKRVNQQIFLITIMTITIPLIITSIIIYIFSVESVKNEYQNSSNLVLNNLSFNFDQYLQSIEIGTLSIQMNDQLQNALEKLADNNSDDGESLSIQHESAIEHFTSTIGMSIKNVDSVQIYVEEHVFYSTLFNRQVYYIEDLENEDWHKQTLEQKGGTVLFGTHKPFHRLNSDEKVISIARVINKKGSREALGVLLIDIRLDSLREILNLSENRNRNFVILDNNGGIIYASDQAQITPSMRLRSDSESLLAVLEEDSGSFYASIAGIDSFVNFVTSPYSDWTVVQYIDKKEMTKHAELLRKIILWLAFGSLATAIVFMFILNARVTKPIIFLSKQVKKVGKGEFNVDLSSNRQDEFGILYKGISKMVTDIQDYIERSSILKAQQKLAQYRALKSQIHPHFLANALESIQMKAILDNQKNISEMIGVLGQLFRISIQTGKETVTLEEELIHARLYVKVQQMRFGDKIQYIENLTPNSEDAHILHFSIQPIIENAIIHGLEPKSGQGVIEVSTIILDYTMLISVQDNGLGIDEEKLQQIQDRLATPSNTLSEEHIGIKNVHDQIRFYFGNQYGIDIKSQLGTGTTVTIYIPIN